MLPRLDKSRAKFYLSRQTLLESIQHQEQSLAHKIKELKNSNPESYVGALEDYLEFDLALDELKNLLIKKQNNEAIEDEEARQFEPSQTHEEIKTLIASFQQKLDQRGVLND